MSKLWGAIMAGALFTATLTQPFFARAGEIENRQKRQQERIAEGIESGALTPKEATRLEAQEAAIQREKQYFKRDGKLGPKERAKLNRDLNRTSRHIYREKHD
jgi:hypothetical protein